MRRARFSYDWEELYREKGNEIGEQRKLFMSACLWGAKG